MSQPSPAGDTPISFKANAFKGRGQTIEQVGRVPNLGTKVTTETTSLSEIRSDVPAGGTVGNEGDFHAGASECGSQKLLLRWSDEG